MHRISYRNLRSIELSLDTIAPLKRFLPELVRDVSQHNAPIENVVRTPKDRQFALVFTMTVLQHIDSDSE